ncbi:hypothetical protein CR969_02390 [Candidatus Saccharibacteria bacterium]|nr:MAG: hypothetical protein CR969_02390 [Candidatus Saccharibacteria bacterium]
MRIKLSAAEVSKVVNMSGLSRLESVECLSKNQVRFHSGYYEQSWLVHPDDALRDVREAILDGKSFYLEVQTICSRSGLEDDSLVVKSSESFEELKLLPLEMTLDLEGNLFIRALEFLEGVFGDGDRLLDRKVNIVEVHANMNEAKASIRRRLV